MKPNGYRNQPPRPRSVIRSNTSSNHCGKVRAQALAAVSMRNMQATEAISMTMTTAIAPADGGGTLARGARTRTQSPLPKIPQHVLPRRRRGQDLAAIHGAPAEAKTAMLIGRPVLTL